MMETLTEIQKRHSAILMMLNTVESILAPRITAPPHLDCGVCVEYDNVERLAKNCDFISNDTCKVRVNENTFTPNRGDTGVKGEHTARVVSIEGENFGFSFRPDMVCYIKKKFETKFKQAEACTKKAAKAMKPSMARRKNEPVRPAKKAEYQPIQGLTQERKDQYMKARDPHYITTAEAEAEHKETNLTPARLSINTPEVLTINSMKPHINSKNDYICVDMHDKSKYPVCVNLVIKKKYFDQIISGAKKKEYRAPSKFNARLLGFKDTNGKYSPRKDITHIRFINGYKENSPSAVVECKELGCYTFVNEIPEGLKKGDVAIEICLGEVVELNT